MFNRIFVIIFFFFLFWIIFFLFFFFDKYMHTRMVYIILYIYGIGGGFRRVRKVTDVSLFLMLFFWCFFYICLSSSTRNANSLSFSLIFLLLLLLLFPHHRSLHPSSAFLFLIFTFLRDLKFIFLFFIPFLFSLQLNSVQELAQCSFTFSL